ncbi:GTP-binding protein [Pseudomonas sp. zfem004]|uniref:GTP-binding protein n=1 Tax=Pseudomonas sp. zfem004 TaxID=3078199 RepID=UPI002927FDCD|nr:GTP-binding protein [Pseudomonas sp. zfem004]MDU9402355.1 GTP-binding protein [Pseudomonas sp. zfem004]
MGFIRSKPQSNVVTIGHAGHGKTTLTAALIRYSAEIFSSSVINFGDTSISVEDQARLAATSASPISLESTKRCYSHVDCVGNAEQVKNTLAKAPKIDGAILVCSAVEGPEEQTDEHLKLCSQLDIKAVVVFLNKAELQEDDEQCELIEMQVRELLIKHGFQGDDATVVAGSALKALKGENGQFGTDAVFKLFNAMENTFPTSPLPTSNT